MERDILSVVAADPTHLESERLLAIAYAQSHRYEEAVSSLEKVVRSSPGDVDALIWLAISKKSIGEAREAIEIARAAVTTSPGVAITHNTLGLCLLAGHQLHLAIEAFQTATKLDPTAAAIHHNLGCALQQVDRGREAIHAFRDAIEASPEDLAGYISLSELLIDHSRPEEAIEFLERARRIFVTSPAIYIRLARAYSMLGNTVKAEKYFRIAISYDPPSATSYGIWLQEEGRREEAAACFRASIEAQPRQGFAYYGLVQSDPGSADSILLPRIGELSDDHTLHPMERMYLAYAQGHIRERKGLYAEAMRSFDLANDLAYQLHNEARGFDPERERATNEWRTQEHSNGAPSESDKPIFIVGMIRSGTTLLDQIVSSHPDVTAVGELRFWIEGAKASDQATAYLDELDRWAPGAKRVTDKMPLNYLHLGDIHQAFPNAKILHIRRNPLDTCLSIYTTYLGPAPHYAYRRENIVFFYQEYLRIMDLWGTVLPADCFLEIDYETLVTDPQPVIKQVLSFCELPWDSACLHPEDNRSAIRTPSLWQARGPIVTTSVEKWRRYEPWLGEFSALQSTEISEFAQSIGLT